MVAHNKMDTPNYNQTHVLPPSVCPCSIFPNIMPIFPFGPFSHSHVFSFLPPCLFVDKKKLFAHTTVSSARTFSLEGRNLAAMPLSVPRDD